MVSILGDAIYFYFYVNVDVNVNLRIRKSGEEEEASLISMHGVLVEKKNRSGYCFSSRKRSEVTKRYGCIAPAELYTTPTTLGERWNFCKTPDAGR